MLAQIYHIPTMAKHPDPQFHADADYTSESIERAKVDCVIERLQAGADPFTGILGPSRVIAMPLRSKLADMGQPSCAEVIDRAVETFSVAEVVRCVALVLCANGIDIYTQTINELAQGEEQQ